MFTDQLQHYISISNTKSQPRLIFDTQNQYEFTMVALLVDDQWYALVENSDSSRIGDIDEVIKEEFGAAVRGWCVLRRHQPEIGSSIVDFSRGDQDYDAIVYHDKYSSTWLLKIEPKKSSRLLAESQ